MKKVLPLLPLLLATGCVTNPYARPVMDDPTYAPKYPVVKVPQPTTSGSIFADAGYTSLYDDTVARRVGDIIMVSLNESTQSTKSASTNISKSTSSSMPEATLLGKRISVPPLNGGVMTELENDSDFSGSSGADQSNSLQGSIAVTIQEVLPNGTYVVRGEKWMRLNQGDEYIRITGMVRSVDVTAENTVDSTKVANARITYGGKGVMDDSNRIGWLARFFVSPWFGY